MKTLHAFLALSLLLAPALVLAEEAAALSPTAQAVPADASATAKTEEALPADAPALPDSGGVENAPSDELKDVKPSEVEVPKEDPAKQAPGKAVPEKKESKYKLGNFVLGFLGGAALGGAYGVLSSGGKEEGTMGRNAAIYGGAAALVLGTAGVFLGATTPEEAKPPRVESALPRTPLLIFAARF